jgi:hypothetical protein
MEETPAAQYFSCPTELMFHLAESETHTVCGFYAGEPSPKRRKDDWRLTPEEPKRLIDALCPKCRRRINGEPEPEIDWRALAAHHFTDMPI